MTEKEIEKRKKKITNRIEMAYNERQKALMFSEEKKQEILKLIGVFKEDIGETYIGTGCDLVGDDT